MAPLVRTGGSRHTGLAAPPHRNIQSIIFRAIISAFVGIFMVSIFNCKSEAMSQMWNRYLRPMVQIFLGKLNRRN